MSTARSSTDTTKNGSGNDCDCGPCGGGVIGVVIGDDDDVVVVVTAVCLFCSCFLFVINIANSVHDKKKKKKSFFLKKRTVPITIKRGKE